MPGGHSVITIDNLRVSSDQVLGEVGQGFNTRAGAPRPGPPHPLHALVGAARRAHDIATSYAMQRRASARR